MIARCNWREMVKSLVQCDSLKGRHVLGSDTSNKLRVSNLARKLEFSSFQRKIPALATNPKVQFHDYSHHLSDMSNSMHIQGSTLFSSPLSQILPQRRSATHIFQSLLLHLIRLPIPRLEVNRPKPPIPPHLRMPSSNLMPRHAQVL